MFFKHFANRNQIPGFYRSGTLIENGLIPVSLIYLCFWFLETFYKSLNLAIMTLGFSKIVHTRRTKQKGMCFKQGFRKLQLDETHLFQSAGLE